MGEGAHYSCPIHVAYPASERPTDTRTSRPVPPPVLSQIKGNPWWPALVCKDASDQILRGRRYHVVFYGDLSEGYCHSDNMCNFELNLGSLSAEVPGKGRRKRQAAIDDALAELQTRQHAQAPLTATRSSGPSPKAPPRKRPKRSRASGASKKNDAPTSWSSVGQSSSDVLELLQQAATEIEQGDKQQAEPKQDKHLSYLTPQNRPVPGPYRDAGSGRNTPPPMHDDAVADLAFLAMTSNVQTISTPQTLPSNLGSAPISRAANPAMQTAPPAQTLAKSAFSPVIIHHAPPAKPPNVLEQYRPQLVPGTGVVQSALTQFHHMPGNNLQTRGTWVPAVPTAPHAWAAPQIQVTTEPAFVQPAVEAKQQREKTVYDLAVEEEEDEEEAYMSSMQYAAQAPRGRMSLDSILS